MPGSLTLEEFNDAEFFNALRRAADEDGWAVAEDIAEQIGITNDYPTTSVGCRLGWARKYGFVEKETDKGDTLWRLTPMGEALANPHKVSASLEKALDGLDEAQRAKITEAMVRELPGRSREAIHYTRRNFRHFMGGWRDPATTPQRKK